MNIIRKVYVTRELRYEPIKTVYGNKIPIELEVMDYDISGTTANVYSEFLETGKVFQNSTPATVTGNKIVFTPDTGLFLPGPNKLQVQLIGVRTFALDVKCHKALDQSGKLPENPEKVLGALDRALAAADQATTAAKKAVDAAEGVASLTEIGVDTTLTVTGAAADAKTTGAKIGYVKSCVLLDYGSLIGNSYISTTSGELISFTSTDNASYFSTDYVSIDGISSLFINITFRDSAGIAFYDSQKNFISGYANSNGYADIGKFVTIDVPNDAKYLRTSKLERDTMVIPSIEIYAINLPNSIAELGKEISDVFGLAYDNRYQIDHLPIGYKWGNIFNKNAATIGKALNRSGQEYDAPDYACSEFIPCKGATGIYRNLTGDDLVAFYDRNKVFIAGVPFRSITTESLSGAYYFRFNLHSTNLSRYFVSFEQDVVKSYEYLDYGLIPNGLIVKAEEKKNDGSGLIDTFDTVGCIGDSLASGEVYYKKNDGSYGGIDMYQYSWGQFLSKMTGNTYYNFSRGGLRADTWLTDSKGAPMAFDGDHKCKAYIIGLGQNDANTISRESIDPAVYVGTKSDINPTDYTRNSNTFYGNYGKIIQMVKEHQPKAKIFCVTDIYSPVETYGINNAIRDMPNIFQDVYLIDLYTYESPVYLEGFIKACRRSGHYNAIAYRYMASIIAKYIDQIMFNNPTEFLEVEFIGTEYHYYD